MSNSFVSKTAYLLKYVPLAVIYKSMREMSIKKEDIKSAIYFNRKLSPLYSSRADYLEQKGIGSQKRFFNPQRLRRKSILIHDISSDCEILFLRHSKKAGQLAESDPKKIFHLTWAARIRVRQADIAQYLGWDALAKYKLERAIEFYANAKALIQKNGESSSDALLAEIQNLQFRVRELASSLPSPEEEILLDAKLL